MGLNQLPLGSQTVTKINPFLHPYKDSLKKLPHDSISGLKFPSKINFSLLFPSP